MHINEGLQEKFELKKKKERKGTNTKLIKHENYKHLISFDLQCWLSEENNNQTTATSD